MRHVRPSIVTPSRRSHWRAMYQKSCGASQAGATTRLRSVEELAALATARRPAPRASLTLPRMTLEAHALVGTTPPAPRAPPGYSLRLSRSDPERGHFVFDHDV